MFTPSVASSEVISSAYIKTQFVVKGEEDYTIPNKTTILQVESIFTEVSLK